jgi:hypothetical protein
VTGIRIEFDEVRRLAVAFVTAEQVAAVEARAIVAKGALNIKRDWQQRWSGHAHIPALPSAITYDVTRTPLSIAAEIGPDKSRAQGPLGNIIEFGTRNNAPIPGGLPALQAELPRFTAAAAAMPGPV